MREYKFKGKRVDNGEWVYGKLFFLDNPKYYSILPIGSDVYSEISANGETGRYLIEPVEVVPETIGQHTGLLDKNGKEIYEGDVLRNVDNPLVDKLPFKVVWNDYYGAWFWLALEGEDRTDHFYQSIASDCESIGNIHDKE
jgi:uncharacterized phage protein (TIGR01671 family)